MICFRNFRVGDQVRLFEGVYEGMSARVMKVRPQGATFVSHIRVQYDLKEHDLDDKSKMALYAAQKRWQPVTSWEHVR
jgi:hypothetical protein